MISNNVLYLIEFFITICLVLLAMCIKKDNWTVLWRFYTLKNSTVLFFRSMFCREAWYNPYQKRILNRVKATTVADNYEWEMNFNWEVFFLLNISLTGGPLTKFVWFSVFTNILWMAEISFIKICLSFKLVTNFTDISFEVLKWFLKLFFRINKSIFY